MTSVKITTTGELLAVLPHQLGHQLDRCVVIAMVRGKALGPVARTDLPDERDVRRRRRPAPREPAAGGARARAPRRLRVGAGGVALAAPPLCTTGLRRAGVGIIDHVVVRDGSWWGACCRPSPRSLDGLRAEPRRRPRRCPTPRPCPPSPSSSPPAAPRCASRDEVERPRRRGPGRRARGVGEALDRLEREGGLGRRPGPGAAPLGAGARPRGDSRRHVRRDRRRGGPHAPLAARQAVA